MNFDKKDFEVFLRMNPVLVALTGRGQRLHQLLVAAVRRHSLGRCSLRHRSAGVGGFRLSLEKQVASVQIRQDKRWRNVSGEEERTANRQSRHRLSSPSEEQKETYRLSCFLADLGGGGLHLGSWRLSDWLLKSGGFAG